MYINIHFSSIGEKFNNMLPHSNTDPCNSLRFNVNSSFFINPVSPDEISSILGKLKSTKSNLNVLPVCLIRQVKDSLSIPLARIINSSFENGIFPEIYKTATITPIHKDGPKNDVQNYRPISILPNFGKVIEKCMASRLFNYLSKKNIISPEQFGFQPRKNTTDAISKLVEKIYTSFNRKEFAVGIFLDFKSAFDSVSHSILISKLNRYGIRGMASSWFANYLINRKQRVRIENSFSELKTVSFGLPQGSSLSPILFLLYVNDLCTVSSKFSNFLFADDATFFLSDQNLGTLLNFINIELTKLANWTISNRLTINTRKTVAMIFSNRPYNASDAEISINSVRLNIVREHKFLGLMLDDRLHFKAHIKMVSAKISKNIGIFYRTRNFLNSSAKSELYYCFVYPYFLYANLIWGGAYPSLLDPLVKLQKRIIRIITDQAFLAHTSPLFRSTGILKFQDIHKFILGTTGFNSANIRHSLPSHQVNTRNRHRINPPFQRLTICQQSAAYSVPTFWNSLPPTIKIIDKFNLFKKNLKIHLMSDY